MAGFYHELRRRRVFGTISIYVVGAWLLIQVADVLFPGWNIAEENIRYLVYMAIGCFPVAFVVGWKYDITTHGIKRTPPSTKVSEEISLSLNKADHLLLAFLAIATISIVVGFGRNINSNPVLEITNVLPNSVAILPFTNLSEEPDNEFFSTGLWQEMISAMGRIDGFRVTPATSAGYFRNRKLDLAEIKQKLRVANVIVGSVQRAANQVRITLSLSDTGEGTNLWSQTYDRDLRDIFAIQSDIAHAVAEVMKVKILGVEEELLDTPPTSSAEAHDMLMLADEADDFKRAIELADRAIELDPTYVDAYLARGFLAMISWFMPGGGGVDAALELCTNVLEKSIELKPNITEVSNRYHWLNGVCLRRKIWLGRGGPDMEREMEAAFKKTIELNPSISLPHISYAIYLRGENRIRETEDQVRQALELDRLNQTAMIHLTRVLSIQGKDDEAIEWNERIIEYFGDGYGILAERHADLGHYDRAIEVLLRAPDVDEQILGSQQTVRSLLTRLFRVLRDPESVEKYTNPETEDHQADEGSLQAALGRAWSLARDGNYDEAFEIANTATEMAGTTEWYILNEPAELAVMAGRYKEAIQIYERALPNLVDPIRPDVQKNTVGDALLFAHALQKSGDTSRATVLFGRILDVIEGRRRIGMENVGIIDACVFASLGETDKAIAAIREAV
ncbi:MAG: tetratricopeptide repeat protein, partial [Gammaproteobacteria bacterium]|nr:tetratricopeptide repeat protein [Gammaproteobacteria bacterium]